MTMKLKFDYFIASRWRNYDTIIDLVKKLRKKGKSVYCFLYNKEQYMEITQDPEETMQKYENTPNWRKDPNVIKMFEDDMEGLKASEKLILLLPAGKSSHIEAGVAYGLGKKCILIGEQKEAESLYCIFSDIYINIDSFLKSI